MFISKVQERKQIITSEWEQTGVPGSDFAKPKQWFTTARGSWSPSLPMCIICTLSFWYLVLPTKITEQPLKSQKTFWAKNEKMCMSKNYLVGDVPGEGEAAEDEWQTSSDGEVALSKCKSMLLEKFSHHLSHTSTRSHAASWTARSAGSQNLTWKTF